MNNSQPTFWRVRFGILLLLCFGWSMDAVEQLPLNERLTLEAWNAYNAGQFPNAIKLANRCIGKFSKPAKRLQRVLEQQGAVIPTGAVSNAVRDMIFTNGLLNDVGTCLFIRGIAQERLGRTKAARKTFTQTLKFSYARTWDPRGWFWSPAEAANARLNPPEPPVEVHPSHWDLAIAMFGRRSIISEKLATLREDLTSVDGEYLSRAKIAEGLNYLNLDDGESAVFNEVKGRLNRLTQDILPFWEAEEVRSRGYPQWHELVVNQITNQIQWLALERTRRQFFIDQRFPYDVYDRYGIHSILETPDQIRARKIGLLNSTIQKLEADLALFDQALALGLSVVP